MTVKPVAEPASDDVSTAQTADLPQQTPELDDFDDLRLDQSFEGGAAKKLITVIPIKKPPKQGWVRVHPDPAYRREMHILELKEDREIYGVTAGVAPYVTDEIQPVVLYTAITRQNSLFLWHCRLPGPDGRDMDWHRSQRLAAETSMKTWVRVRANTEAGAYDVAVPVVAYPDPEWPDMSFRQILEIAFRGKLIKTPDHPVLLRLQGRA